MHPLRHYKFFSRNAETAESMPTLKSIRTTASARGSQQSFGDNRATSAASPTASSTVPSASRTASGIPSSLRRRIPSAVARLSFDAFGMSSGSSSKTTAAAVLAIFLRVGAGMSVREITARPQRIPCRNWRTQPEPRESASRESRQATCLPGRTVIR